MNLKQSRDSVQTAAITVSVRRVQPRVGTTHTYELNGTLLRDVLVEGRWVTVSTSCPLQVCAA
jgi:hypothetical protein